MASVAAQTPTETWVAHSLAYLAREWAAIPRISGEWEDWDEADRLDFVLEWPLREDRLLQLRRCSAEGRLTESQDQRFQELETLVQRHQSALARLLVD